MLLKLRRFLKIQVPQMVEKLVHMLKVMKMQKVLVPIITIIGIKTKLPPNGKMNSTGFTIF
jgi:hypothetical protein